ncbi:MAG: hypothetical protein IRY99_09505 [Isosphaeraceae bacterium]|nr:hypothetical protein [Isosphaeraceae bacterium]
MRCYRTEIVIPPDRYVGLQLPPHLPEGRAIVTVVLLEPEADEAPTLDTDPDRQDIEWWEEFDGEGDGNAEGDAADSSSSAGREP